MPIPTQQGDVASRLRRFFAIRGRAGTSVDEIVVPTAQLARLDRSPWRLNEVAWSGWLNVAARGAGTFNKVGVYLPATARVAVVERIYLLNQAASSARNFSIGYFDAPATNLNNYAEKASYDTEDWRRGPSVVPAAAPMIFTGDNGVTLGEVMREVRLRVDETLIVPVNVVLYGDLGRGEAIRSLVVNDTTANSLMSVAFSGVYYPEVD